MEASDLFAQFQQLWRAGTNARLNLECHAGQAWMSLHVHLPCPPRQQQQQHHRGRPGPSRLRRRARRAKAREKAAEKVVDISTDNSQPFSSNAHVAEQATTEETIVEKLPIDAVIQTQTCFSDAAAQVDQVSITITTRSTFKMLFAPISNSYQLHKLFHHFLNLMAP